MLFHRRLSQHHLSDKDHFNMIPPGYIRSIYLDLSFSQNIEISEEGKVIIPYNLR